jgi:hypothetical protein
MPDKQGAIITTEEVSLSHIQDKRKYLVSKCPDGRPASFELKYADKWMKEDGRHFHRTLMNYNLEPKIRNKDKFNLAINSLRAKKQSIIRGRARGLKLENEPNPEVEDFTVDQEDKLISEVEQNNTIINYVRKNIGAKYVKVLKNQEPVKVVWSDRQFCMHEEISPRTLRRLRTQGIDVFFLKKSDPDRYYNSFTRCYYPSRHNYNGRKLCDNHYRDARFGKDIREDFTDES